MALKMTSMYLEQGQQKRLRRVGKRLGGLKMAQVIRMAVAEFLVKNEDGQNT